MIVLNKYGKYSKYWSKILVFEVESNNSGSFFIGSCTNIFRIGKFFQIASRGQGYSPNLTNITRPSDNLTEIHDRINILVW